MIIIATVVSWGDDGEPLLLLDQHKVSWLAIFNLANGTIAVESCIDDMAGVFYWQDKKQGTGTIEIAIEGALYNTVFEYNLVARAGEWLVARKDRWTDEEELDEEDEG